MRKPGSFAVVAIALVVVLVVAAFRWIWVSDAPPPLVPGPAATEAVASAESGAPATARETTAARVEEPPLAVPERHGRYGVRGIVRLAADGSPAARARVRVFASPPPLARMPFRDAMSRAGSGREPAAVHDISNFFGGDRRNDRDDGDGSAAPPPPAPEPAVDSAGDDAPDDADKPAGGRTGATPLAEVLTDASGRFELLGLEPASFHVDAIAPLTVAKNAIEVKFAPGSEETVRDGVELLLVGGAAVRGHVRTPDGKPVAGAEVVLNVPFDPFAMFSAEGMDLRAPASAHTDDEGRFEFAAIPAPLDLKARSHAEGFADSATTSLVARAGVTSELELVMTPGAAIVVHVTDEQGADLADVPCRCDPTKLDLSNIAADARAFERKSPRSGADGIARFDGLTLGKWRVTADARGRLATSQIVELLTAGSSTTVELRVERGLELRGSVRAKDGTPIAGAQITAYPEPGFANLSAMTGNTGRRRGKSGDDGAFSVPGLASGKLVIEANAPGYQPANLKAAAGGEPVDIVLASRGVLEGIVMSRKTTKPVTRYDLKVARKKEAGGLLAMSTSANAAESMIDLTLPFTTPNGKFRIVGVNPGSLRLTCKAAGHGEKSTDWIELKEGETRKGILVYLDPEAVIEGIVVDAASGAPVAGAEVRRDTGGGNALENVMSQFFVGSDAKSDGEGRFRMEGLGAGAYRLIVSHADYVDASPAELQLDAGQTASGVRIELEKGGEIFGSVIGPDGAGIAAAPVFVQDMTRFKMRSVKCDELGAYRIGGLAPGNFTVTRMPESMDLGSENFMADITSNLQTRTVRLKAGESLRVDFTGAPQGNAALRGTVRQGGKPLGGAVVNVFVQGVGSAAGNGGMKSTATESDGEFEFSGLVAGPAFVQVNQADMGMDGGISAAVATVTLVDGETVRVDLEVPAGTITGSVVDAATGAPLPGVAVYAASTGETGESMLELAMRRAMTVRTDPAGAFRLRNLRGGVHCIVVGGSDFLAGSAATHALLRRDGVAVPDGGTVDVGVLRLPPAARIEGTVMESNGKPLAGASVFLRDPGTGGFLEEWTATTSNDAGHFEYGGVPDGRWDVVCRAPGHATAAIRGVVAREGTVATVQVRLIGGTEVFADIGEVDFDKLVQLRIEVDGPDGRIPLTLFGLGDLQDLLSRPWRLDVVRLGRFGPGDYRVSGRLGDKTFEKSFRLAGEAELHIPVALP